MAQRNSTLELNLFPNILLSTLAYLRYVSDNDSPVAVTEKGVQDVNSFQVDVYLADVLLRQGYRDVSQASSSFSKFITLSLFGLILYHIVDKRPKEFKSCVSTNGCRKGVTLESLE